MPEWKIVNKNSLALLHRWRFTFFGWCSWLGSLYASATCRPMSLVVLALNNGSARQWMLPRVDETDFSQQNGKNIVASQMITNSVSSFIARCRCVTIDREPLLCTVRKCLRFRGHRVWLTKLFAIFPLAHYFRFLSKKIICLFRQCVR